MQGLRRLSQNPWKELRRLGVTPEYGIVPQPQLIEPQLSSLKALEKVVKGVASAEENAILLEFPRLPLVEVSQLREDEYEHAFLLLQILVQKYYSFLPTDSVGRIPRNLSIPFKQLAETMGRLPVLQYASLQYHNMALKDPRAGLSPDNIKVPFLLSGTEDEAWFYIAATCVDYEGAPILRSLASYLGKPNDETLVELLRSIIVSLGEMRKALSIIRRGVDPQIFYDQIRVCMKDYSHKVWFEGVSTEEEYYAGPSAIQSPMLRLVNLLLGLQTSNFDMVTAEHYMKATHRDLIEAMKVLDLSSKVPSYLNDLHAECLHSLKAFRQYHLGLVKDFIIRRGPAAQGTGGTNLDRFLQELIKETVPSYSS